MKKVIEVIKRLIEKKFTGTIEIIFNQGGIQGVKKIIKKTVS